MLQTRPSLLVRIRNPQDGLAWGEFVQLYAPLLHAYAMKDGLQDADAADVAQDILRNVLRAAPDFVYDPQRGSFRGWLFTIARNEVHRFAKRRVKRAVVGDSNVRALLDEHPEREADPAEWDQEYQLNLFRWAAERVRVEFRENTWQAFWRTAVGGEDAAAVAAELGITVGAVYIARSRVTTRIRQEIETVAGNDA